MNGLAVVGAESVKRDPAVLCSLASSELSPPSISLPLASTKRAFSFTKISRDVNPRLRESFLQNPSDCWV